MPMVTTRDGVQIYYKDWGPKNGQPLVFHHGWPLSGDDWDTQLLFFLGKGYRVIAHDRRGHGRSTQVSDGHDMDHYAADPLQWSKSSTCATRSILATPRAAAKRRTTSRAMVRTAAVWRSSC
jgi:pimeloyl-ACP methyl ester carboxylesterase